MKTTFTPLWRGLAVLLVIGMMSTSFAAVNNDLSFTVGCEGFTNVGGSFSLTRDNTSNGREAFVIGAVDGTGATVFAPVVDSALVGSEINLGAGRVYAWTNAPSANPITVSVISIAGNDLPEETVYTVSGTCAGLADGTASTVSAGTAITAGDLVTEADLVVSPSVPPGFEVPVATSSAAEIERLPGYGIVDIDNLYLRTGGGPNYTRVAVVDGGTRVRILARNEQFSWWLVNAGGFTGWASAEYIIVRGDVRGVPVLSGVGELIPVTIVTSLPQRIYSAPATFNDNYICDIIPFEHVAIGRDRFNAFYQIISQCEDGTVVTGWVPTEAGAVRNPASLRLPVTD